MLGAGRAHLALVRAHGVDVGAPRASPIDNTRRGSARGSAQRAVVRARVTRLLHGAHTAHDWRSRSIGQLADVKRERFARYLTRGGDCASPAPASVRAVVEAHDDAVTRDLKRRPALDSNASYDHWGKPAIARSPSALTGPVCWLPAQPAAVRLAETISLRLVSPELDEFSVRCCRLRTNCM